MDKIIFVVIFSNGFYYTEDGFGGMIYQLNKAKWYDYDWEVAHDLKLKEYVSKQRLSYQIKKFRCTLTPIN